jgi:hypothetical protein
VGDTLSIFKDGRELSFNKILKMGRGHLMGLRMKPIREYGLIGGGYTFQSIMKSHELLGHPSIESTRKTAQMMNVKLTGKVTRCKDCILAKVKRTNTKKFNENKSKRKGGRLCVDISWVKRSSLGNNKY